MMPIQQLNIAVIGDEDLISGLRLAGMSHYNVITNGSEAESEVRQAMSELIAEPEIGVIALQEDYRQYVEDLITQVQESIRLTPVIIEVPSKQGTKYGDVTEYYKTFIRKIVGFDIEI